MATHADHEARPRTPDRLRLKQVAIDPRYHNEIKKLSVDHGKTYGEVLDDILAGHFGGRRATRPKPAIAR